MPARPNATTVHIHGDEQRTEEFLRSLNTLFAEAIRSAERDNQILQDTLDAGVRAVGGRRGFLAIVNRETGELQVRNTSGPGWTDESRRMRLNLGQEKERGITGR